MTDYATKADVLLAIVKTIILTHGQTTMIQLDQTGPEFTRQELMLQDKPDFSVDADFQQMQLVARAFENDAEVYNVTCFPDQDKFTFACYTRKEVQ